MDAFGYAPDHKYNRPAADEPHGDGQFSMKLFDRWAPRLIPALIVVVPLIFTSAVYDVYDLPKLTLVYIGNLLLFVLWLWQGMAKGSITIRRTPLDIPLILFLAISGISCIYSLDPTLSWYGAYRIYSFGWWPLFSMAVLYFLTVQVVDASIAKTIRRAALFSASCVGLYGILQYSGFEIFTDIPAIQGGRVWSSLGNPVYMGALCMMAIPLLFEGRMARKIVPLVLVWGGLLLSLSRSAWVGTVSSCLVLAYVYRKQMKNWVRPAAGTLLAIGLLVTLMPGIRERMAYLVSSKEASNASRIEGWKAGLRVWKQYPLLGSGPDTFFQAFRPQRSLRYLQVTGTEITQADAHNDVIQMASTEGTLGLLAYLWVVFVFIRSLVQQRPGEPLLWGFSLLALFVQNQFNFSSVATSTWAAIFGGLFFGLQNSAIRNVPLVRARALRGILFFLFVGGLWGIGRSVLADWHYKQALEWLQGDRFVPALEHDREAVRLNGRIEIYGSSLSNAARSAGRLDESWQVAEDQTRRHPANPDVWNNLGVSAMWMVQMAGQNKWQEAKAAFEKAVTLDPVFVDAWANLAKWNHLQGNFDEEKRLWKKVIELDPQNAMALQVLGVGNGNKKI
jgi:O-antigen ligase